MEKYVYSQYNIFFTKICTWIKDVLCSPICVNACLHYSWGKLVHRNWGDDINIFFLEKLWNRKMTYLWASSLFNKQGKTNYLVIGSTITMLTTKDTVIWGGWCDR